MERDKLSSLQILTLVLCWMIVAADGFDVASVGYVAPLLKKEWGLAAAQMGPIFGAGLLGLCVGSFLIGPLADRIGRKRVIIASLILFGIGSLACAYASSALSLTVLRFLTGAGLGGALPTVITLASEFSPARRRALMVTLMLSGFPLGLAFGGIVAAQLIPTFGWQSVFVFGGVFPLLLVPLIFALLPESLKFMAGKPRYAAEARRVLARHKGGTDLVEEAAPASVSATAAAAIKETPIAILFGQHYRIGTLLLWISFFCTLWVYYQLSSWLPTVMTEAGIDVSRAALMAMMMPLGGVFGGTLIAYLMDRIDPYLVLTCSYLMAAVAIALIGMTLHEPVWIYVTVFIAGIGVAGAQTGLNVFAAGFYTTAARATGVSWALAVGRIGSIIGAVTGGMLLAAAPSLTAAFIIFAIPAVISAGAMTLNGRFYRGQARQV